jgi:Fe-S-cluster containining protein
MNYFACRPGELCSGAACCTGQETLTALIVGDYIRLSNATGRSPAEISRKNGDVSLLDAETLLGMAARPKAGRREKGIYVVKLGLFHDPCPYLQSDRKCAVYGSRPMGCADFPLTIFRDRRDELGKYRATGRFACMNAKPSTDQLEFLRRLDEISIKEVAFEEMNFWNPPLIADFSYAESYFGLANRALELEAARGMRPTPRLERLMKAIETINKRRRSGEEIPVYECFHPIAYSLFEDEIARRLDALDEAALEFYRGTTEEYEQLLAAKELVQIGGSNA